MMKFSCNGFSKSEHNQGVGRRANECDFTIHLTSSCLFMWIRYLRIKNVNILIMTTAYRFVNFTNSEKNHTRASCLRMGAENHMSARTIYATPHERQVSEQAT